MIIRPTSSVVPLLFLFTIGCGGGSNSQAPQANLPIDNTPQTIVFHCSKDIACPEILISGDPHSGDNFRGYGDPSLEFDQSTNTLWLSYSWLNILIDDVGPPVSFDLGVATHLAKSIDGGKTFNFVRSVNQPQMESHPDTGGQGWSIHEVSTIAKQPDGEWQLLWLKYFEPFGTVAGVDQRQEFLYWKTTANSPEALGDNSQVWAKTVAASNSWNAPIDFNTIPGLTDCTVLTEPDLFSFKDQVYLASSCLIVDSNGRRTDLERMVLLRQTADSYEFIGNILDAGDATRLGVDVIQQADISIAKDGSLILLATPINLGGNPDHQGCIVFEFDDLSKGTLKRDNTGAALPRAIITAEGNGLGPGLCSYDANSETGILLVITSFTQNDTDIEFSLRATGVHP
jgi:hypothetical protein